MSLRALNMMETTRLGLPFGGTWRFRQEPVLGEHATKKGLILAWDTPSASRWPTTNPSSLGPCWTACASA